MARRADELRLIRTKLNHPRVVDELVPRPALFSLLGKQLEKPLTLVVAPAGYGKTTVVTSWLIAHPCNSCWLSLDEYDSDLGVFLAYLTAAIRQAYLGSCSETGLLLEAASLPSLQVIASSLIDGCGS